MSDPVSIVSANPMLLLRLVRTIPAALLLLLLLKLPKLSDDPGVRSLQVRALALIKAGYSRVKVAKKLDLSRWELYKLLSGTGAEHKFTALTDTELMHKVLESKAILPRLGAVYLQGHLRAQGLTVQRWRIRQMLRALDPAGSASRKKDKLKRREYKVAGPNSLWHADGLHKLIR
jgi:hypothetical protein